MTEEIVETMIRFTKRLLKESTSRTDSDGATGKKDFDGATGKKDEA